jgi:hypothetical protein
MLGGQLRYKVRLRNIDSKNDSLLRRKEMHANTVFNLVELNLDAPNSKINEAV